MKPTVTFCSYGSPVLPLKSCTLPEHQRPSGRDLSTFSRIAWSVFVSAHFTSARSTSASVAPSKTGVAIGCGAGALMGARGFTDRRAPFGVSSRNTPCAAAQPRCVSRIWPMFIRLGTPSGLRITSTGRPSSRNGMSSSGTIFEMTPLLPWRPASLSPSEILRFLAT